MEADASDFALGSILFQYGEDGRLHPIAYHSRKFSVAEINYEIHNKELLPFLKNGAIYLKGSTYNYNIYQGFFFHICGEAKLST
jgi:hypothetical protein